MDFSPPYLVILEFTLNWRPTTEKFGLCPFHYSSREVYNEDLAQHEDIRPFYVTSRESDVFAMPWWIPWGLYISMCSTRFLGHFDNSLSFIS